jgi:hypothetical protein
MLYSLLHKWCVGLSLNAVWDAPACFGIRVRLVAGENAQGVFAAVPAASEQAHLLSSERLPGDGMFLEVWASQESVRPEDEPP